MAASSFEFQRNLPFTEFIENDSWLQKRNPAAFLVSFILYFSSILVIHSWLGFLLALLPLIIGVLLSGYSIRSYLSRMIKVIPLIIIIAMINILLNPLQDPSPVLFKIWILQISSQDLTLAAFLIIRFLIIMIVVNITTGSLSISRFINGLEYLLNPLTYLGIQVHDFIVSIEIAIRYIPLLTLTSERIAKAQASRGAAWGASGGNVFQKVKQITPLIIPLFLQSYQKADKIAMAMDARGYGASKKRSHYHITLVGPGDWILGGVNGFVLFAAIFFKL